MKLHHFVIFCYFGGILVFARESNTGYSTLNEQNSSTSSNQSRNRCNSMNKTEFMDLSIDCKLLIFEELDVENLLKMARLNSHLKSLAIYVFQRKFASKKVIIGSDALFEGIIVGRSHISIDYSFSLKFLATFGHLIKSFEILNSQIPPEHLVSFGMLVNEHCSDTLVEFTMEGEMYVLDGMKKPFESIVNVTFESNENISHNCSVKLNELFPKVQRLNLNLYLGQRKNFDCHFPHLHDVHIGYATCRDDYVQFLTKNPQIRKLSSSYIHLEFLQDIKTLLPQLKSLGFEMKHFQLTEGPKVQFENVKEVLIHAKSEDSTAVEKLSETMEFENLERLSFSFTDKQFGADVVNKIDDKWIDFIGNHKKLKKLNIIRGCIDEAAILKLSSMLNRLIETQIICEEISMRTVSKFIENNTDLIRITLIIVNDGTNSRFEEFNKEFSDEWKINYQNDGRKFESIHMEKIDYDHQST